MLQSILVVSVDHGFAVAGRTVANSLASYHLFVCSSKDPIVGPSSGLGSMLGVFWEIMGVASPPLPSEGASGVFPGDGVGSLGSQSGVSSGMLGVPSSTSSAPSCASFSGVASFAPPGSFFPSFLPSSGVAFPPLIVSGAPPVISRCPYGFPLAPPVASVPPVISAVPPVASSSRPISALLSSVASSCVFSSVASL